MRFVVDNVRQKKYWGYVGLKKGLIVVLLLFLLASPAVYFLYLFFIKTFAHQGLTQGKVIRYEKLTTKTSAYFYQYHVNSDSAYTGMLSPDGCIDVGDTIDVIYDKDSIGNSYAPSEKYFPVIGDIAFNQNYKKYWNKVKSSKGSHSKYVGTPP